MWRVIATLWTAPNTLLGIVFAVLARVTGGSWAWHTGVLEASGGAVAVLLRRAPIGSGGAAAITIGHVVLGQDRDLLDATRRHERVHVRQYERWGPLFLPAYAVGSLWAWSCGRDFYRGNPFEVEAYAASDGPEDSAP